MKYYLVGHTAKLDEYLGIYKGIISILSSKAGWKLVDNWIDKEVEFQSQEPNKRNRFYKYYKDLYKNTTNKIKESDIVIAEMSEKSTTVAQQVIYALENNIPVWCFCQKDKKNNIPLFLFTRQDKKLVITFYDPRKLESIIRNKYPNFFKRELKFNFYLTQDMYDFLEKLSREKKSTKSKIVREIILSEMKKKVSWENNSGG